MHPSNRTAPTLYLLLFSLVFVGCSGTQNLFKNRGLETQLRKAQVFNEHFTGLAVYDLSTNTWLYQKNADRHFTPASNTKLITFYACLKTLGDSLQGLAFEERTDTLLFTGTGDPTFLHPDFSKKTIFDFLAAQPDSTKLIYVPGGSTARFGSGWAWDDYSYDFQPELSSFPIYGNVVRFHRVDTGAVANPPLFKDLVETTEKPVTFRDFNYNFFQLPQEGKKENWDVPFVTSPELITQLLSDTLKRKVSQAKSTTITKPKYLKSVPTNLIYSIMLKRSDNFYAEQLLLMSARKKGFGWRTDVYRNFILKEYLNDLPQKIIWRDGSGLSRYNLVTPASMVMLLTKIEKEIGFQKISQLFPVGGESGTIRKWYGASTPYVFAKTGTLSNNHNLSGFMKTSSGKLLAFSFMNNNYIRTNDEVKQSMQQVLEFIRDRY